MPDYRKIKVAYGQTVADIAIQYYGCIEAGIKVVQDNPAAFTSIESIPKPATVLKIEKPVPVITANNVAIANQFDVQGINVATGYKYQQPVGQITAEDGFEITTEGGSPIITETPTVTTEGGIEITTEDNQNLGG